MYTILKENNSFILFTIRTFINIYTIQKKKFILSLVKNIKIFKTKKRKTYLWSIYYK